MTQPFLTGTLWSQVRDTFDNALEIGALQPIPTDYSWVAQGEIPFLVRVVDNLRRKELAKERRNKGLPQIKKKNQDFNPFLPYDPDLFVCNLSSTHLVLLNKFNVMDHHILIVTRAFEEQSNWLNLHDFEAFNLAAQEMDGLGFYNAGTLAGASQRHKHLQLVPTPLAPEGPSLPFSPWIDTAAAAGLERSPELPFQHAIALIPASYDGKLLFDIYCQLMLSTGMGHPQTSDQPQGAYNLLITRQWMMAVPRTQEKFEGISINSLGFSGAMLVKSNKQLLELKELGPMNILKAVGG